MPRQVLITTAVLTLMAGALGFWLGLRWQPLDETQVISGVAAHYATETGGDPGDCVAMPGQGDVWLRVICNAVEYRLDARGRLMNGDAPDL